MSDGLARNLRFLLGVQGGTSPTLRAHTEATYDQGGPSIQIESAEGITTFPGLNGDPESVAARNFICDRVDEIDSRPAH
ncbi:MAG TPA: hypothetical protein VIH71_12265 [Solirubrobacteraceae bacterium]